MGRKIIYCLICITLFTFRGFSQKPLIDVFPLRSNQKDVVKMLGSSSKVEKNQSTYNLKDADVTFTFYKSGCNPSFEAGTLIEIKETFTDRQLLFDLVDNAELYEKYDYTNNRTLYFNSRDGILIISKDRNPLGEVESIYFMPSGAAMTNCINANLNENSGVSILNEVRKDSTNADRLDLPALKIGGYFDEDSEKSKNAVLADFADKLMKYKNGLGYVVIFKGEDGTTSSNIQLKKQKILSEKLKAKGVPCNKLVFINGGAGRLSGYFFSIVHKSSIKDTNFKTFCK